jgi:glyoxylase-like metal-dependent hydrolase (beta-lactamase superfamily II)
MKRITLAALAASTMLIAGIALAQQQPNWDAIQIKTTDLGNKTYMLEGQGGNITVAVGSDGIMMVDGQFAPLSEKIMAAIKAISPLPIKYMVNTHFHGDHTGGNDNFQKAGVTVVALPTASPATRRRRARPRRCRRRPISAVPRRWKSAAASWCLPTSPMPIPTATPGSSSRTPTCSPPATS